MSNLIIVESPTKVKTIKKFLGSNYQVIASYGHIRDLPKSRLGIDVENDFEPQYITIRGKGETLADIKKVAKKSNKIYLATDPDREGEAISWHLKSALKLDNKEFYRITFNEITKTAVKAALKNPRKINMDLVDAQQARRVVDRIVGYKISPLLWKKVKKGLSAGRVQSVALKIITEREKTISEFITQEYYSIDAEFISSGKKFSAVFVNKNNEKLDISPNAVAFILEDMKDDKYKILEIKKTPKKRLPPAPFTTSSMQQEASKRLNFTSQKTMKIAQELYEGIKIDGHGVVGLITYLRTDSTRISEEAKASSREYIKDKYGEEYIGNEFIKRKNSNIQDAHEAIRPSYLEFEPIKISNSLSKDQLRLYSLIWDRFIASQMSPSKSENTSLKIVSEKGYNFKASTSKLLFKGYTMVYENDKSIKTSDVIDKITYEDEVNISTVKHNIHYTEPPAHYTEASLIKELEGLGIGRPSTYAPTITTLKTRRYITIDKKQIFVTELGTIVNDIMTNYFSTISNIRFTAYLEKELDEIAEGKKQWKSIIKDNYGKFEQELNHAEEKLEKVVILDEVTDEICEKCGKNMVVKYGPKGKFLACPGFPECKNARPFYKKIGILCPQCGGEIVERLTPKNRKYFGCINYPNCDFATWKIPTGKLCTKCNSPLVELNNKIICSNKVCKYEEK